MPRNVGRSANFKKANIPSASNNEDDDSNVIFGDPKAMKKVKHGSIAESSAGQGGNNVPASSEDPLKKPDPRKLVSNSQNSSVSCRFYTKAIILRRVSRNDFPWLKSYCKKQC